MSDLYLFVFRLYKAVAFADLVVQLLVSISHFRDFCNFLAKSSLPAWVAWSARLEDLVGGSCCGYVTLTLLIEEMADLNGGWIREVTVRRWHFSSTFSKMGL